MKKELGKWLMDIAKYITTAVMLSSIFGEVHEKWIIYIYRWCDRYHNNTLGWSVACPG